MKSCMAAFGITLLGSCHNSAVDSSNGTRACPESSSQQSGDDFQRTKWFHGGEWNPQAVVAGVIKLGMPDSTPPRNGFVFLECCQSNTQHLYIAQSRQGVLGDFEEGPLTAFQDKFFEAIHNGDALANVLRLTVASIGGPTREHYTVTIGYDCSYAVSFPEGTCRKLPPPRD